MVYNIRHEKKTIGLLFFDMFPLNIYSQDFSMISAGCDLWGPEHLHLLRLQDIKRGLIKPKAVPTFKYLITFTTRPGVDHDAFKASVAKQLSRKVITGGEYAFEHPDSNLHCHAFITANHRLTKSNFSSHIKKFGNIDLKRILYDNGVRSYIGKESTPISIS